jgi:hypothetical protein
MPEHNGVDSGKAVSEPAAGYSPANAALRLWVASTMLWRKRHAQPNKPPIFGLENFGIALLIANMNHRSLFESIGFLASSSLLGDPEAVDLELLSVTNSIASNAEAFPVVSGPGIRMAAPEGARWAIFFRIQDRDSAELLWLCSMILEEKAA